MEIKKIDITSTVLEKSIDVAKDFLDKLITPTIEEVGLLLKDQVTFWKFKNQIKILNKAKGVCERNAISPKAISLKLLCPLLDNAALEEDEFFQDTWAVLLSNLVDSDQNIANHVFPYILGQISTDEYKFIEKEFKAKKQKVRNLKAELNEFKVNRVSLERKLTDEINDINQQILENSKNKNQAEDYSFIQLKRKKMIYHE
ncbi:MAG TPA: hypothetical protein VNX40_15810 [Mucilaginibacter sp.]|jgi:hypothetical protein|nr:hypothetical protein [Mucilaginibacter sp.]